MRPPGRFTCSNMEKNNEGYWNAAKMSDHTSDTIKAANVVYLNHKRERSFDWSSYHHCQEEGVPSVTKMNVGFEGRRDENELAPMDVASFEENIALLRVFTSQNLDFQADNDPRFYTLERRVRSKREGVTKVLWERGLLVPIMTRAKACCTCL